MSSLKKSVLPVLLATVWISVSEFFRNEFLLKSYWVEHYQAMGLTFPGDPVNGAVWGLWSFVFACLIFVLAKKFTVFETVSLGWVLGFVMMWLVIGNLQVLPYGILPVAVPLSLIEVLLAVWIVKKLS